MSSYRQASAITDIVLDASFSAKLQGCVEEKSRLGRAGIDRNMGKKGFGEALFFRNHEMKPEVFNLGCKLHDENPELQPWAWAHWMVDVDFRNLDEPVFFFRSEFFRNEVDKRLGDMIRNHYQGPVKFRIDKTINERVEQ